MQNKKLFSLWGSLILLVGTAAFVGGRMLNNNVSLLGSFVLGGRGGTMEVSIDLLPAKELPTSSPELIGLFAERKDNIIIVQTTSPGRPLSGENITVQQTAGWITDVLLTTCIERVGLSHGDKHE